MKSLRIPIIVMAVYIGASLTVSILSNQESVSVWGWMVICAYWGGFGACLTWVLISGIIDARRPCIHGTRGAQLKPVLCVRCVREAEEQAALSRREAEEQAARSRAEAQKLAAEEQVRRQKEYDEYRVRIRLPSYLEQMDAREFELLVCDLFRREGYSAESTPFSGDSGVDGYLRRDGKLYLLQCKRTKGSVGQPVLRDLFGTMAHERADGGIVVTTGRVSRQAREWAEGKEIQLIELHELSDMTRRLYSENEVVPPKWQPPSRSG